MALDQYVDLGIMKTETYKIDPKGFCTPIYPKYIWVYSYILYSVVIKVAYYFN